MKTNRYFLLHLHHSLALEVDPTICRLGPAGSNTAHTVPKYRAIFLFVDEHEFGYVWIYVDAEH